MNTNYETYKEKFLSEFCLGDLLHLSDAVIALCSLITAPNEIVDDALELQQDIDCKLRSFQTGRLCPRCGSPLYLSDLPQYEGTCYACDENF